MFKTLRSFLLIFFAAAYSFAQSDSPLLIGRVGINQTHIAFNYAGKIWLVERAGGTAKMLNAALTENNPVFSPDGKRIAFARWNGGDFDIYVSPATGGEATRLTFQNEDDLPVAWTPDGQAVVFESTRDEENLTRLFKVAADGTGALETGLPLPQAFQGSYSPDGKFIAYNPRLGFGEWRYYRGGATAPIYVTDLQSGATEKPTAQNSNDKSPMWLGDKLYFVSDRTGVFNLFVQDRKTKQTKQLTNFDGQGIRTAAGTSDAIVFVQNGRLHLFDTATKQEKIVSVSVAPDTSELRPKTVPAARFVESYFPSSDGAKISVGARGEALIFDAATGEAKNLTNTSGAAERYPMIAPDNKSIAYFSDESGEYALHIRSLETDSVKKITIEPKPSFYQNLAWSPDSKKLVFSDRRLNLWLADSEAGKAAAIDASVYSAQDNFTANFSPDSRYLAYAKRLKNRVGTIFIYDTTTKKSVQITDGIAHTQSPVFDRNGKYLYFLSSPNAGAGEFDWGVLNGALARPLVVRKVHALLLAKDTPSPLLPNNQPNPDAKANEAAPQTKIDFENISRRFVDLPLPPRDYDRLITGKAGKLFLVVDEWKAAPGDFNDRQVTTSVYLFDAAKAGAMQKIVEDIGEMDLSADGSKILFNRGRDWFLVNSETATKPDEGKLNVSKMQINVNPAEEWRQMFHESMRIMRDWFYDPNYHGQNLAALEREYGAYLPTITRRGDLNGLMRQMLGHVSISHLGVGGGDTAPQGGTGNARVGLLGADYAVENGKIRVKKIYHSTSFSAANGSFSAPLDQSGVDIREGDFILEVNGQKIETNRNFYSYFENTTGKPTKITVSELADGSNPRTFTVYPAPGENRLRRANWAEENRRKVEQMSGGKLGYIFIEGYSGDGIMNAIRGLTGYADKQGIIVDQRFNGGGITPDYLIEWMQRKPLYYYHFRGGDDIATPVNPAPPVKVMLINEWNGSAAETGAFMFQLGKVGKIVGKRTYGAGVGPYFFTPRLVDGGNIQLPNRAAYNPNGNWGIENAGVAPDFDVEIMPQDFIAGRDSQIEKAVEVAMAEVAKIKPNEPKLPVFPTHPAAKTSAVNEAYVLPVPGSSFPLTDVKVETAKPVADGKYAEYVGQFETAQGVLTFQQEAEKFVGIAPNGERIELAPDAATKDKFAAQTASVQLTFERGADGKVSGLTLVVPNGQELKGKKIK